MLDLFFLALTSHLNPVLYMPSHLTRFLKLEDIAYVLKQFTSDKIFDALALDFVFHLDDLTYKCILKAVLQMLSLFHLYEFLLKCLESS